MLHEVDGMCVQSVIFNSPLLFSVCQENTPVTVGINSTLAVIRTESQCAVRQQKILVETIAAILVYCRENAESS